MRRCRAKHLPTAHTGGVTLIETLLASALGALLLITLLSLYQRGVAMHAFTESRTEIAETLLTAERVLADELHLAGQLPCGQSGTRFNLVRTNQATPWLRLFEAPVQISPAGGGDQLTVLKTGAPVPLVEHDPAQERMTLTHAADFERGDLAVVCDDDATVLLQITSDAGRVLGYGHAAHVHPGNCSSPFTGGCGPENHRFAQGALVAPYEPVVFFITNTALSLSRKRLVNTNISSGVHARLFTESLIENLALLRVQAGVATAAGHIRLTRDLPVAGPGGGQIVSLDIGLVAAARENKIGLLPAEPLHLFGEPTDGTLPIAASGRRLTAHEFSVAW